ncbi:MAG: hypothetical protein QOD68_358, partial [Actinomycetota bacterium]|nr:hypothetical protein [Actinomycetota bacterium]
MSQSPDSTAQLERDLRAAGRVFDDLPVASDAWQQNQQRLAADRGHRGRILLAVAAALVLVVAVGGLLLGGGNGGKRTLPGDGGDDPFGDSVVLGPPVDVETSTIDGVETTHQAVLSDQTGNGPRVCDRYVPATGASTGCNNRDPKADDPAVAFDWLGATVGGGDIRGVLAGVDSRVSQVRIWMSNGDQTLARLKPAGWEGTQIFGLTVPSAGPRPQRLVAYGRPGVLQTVDLASLLGPGWLPPDKACDRLPTTQLPEVQGMVAAGSIDARVLLQSTPRGFDVCLPLRLPAQGVRAGLRSVVLVIGPEVTNVDLVRGDTSITS